MRFYTIGGDKCRIKIYGETDYDTELTLACFWNKINKVKQRKFDKNLLEFRKAWQLSGIIDRWKEMGNHIYKPPEKHIQKPEDESVVWPVRCVASTDPAVPGGDIYISKRGQDEFRRQYEASWEYIPKPEEITMEVSHEMDAVMAMQKSMEYYMSKASGIARKEIGNHDLPYGRGGIGMKTF